MFGTDPDSIGTLDLGKVHFAQVDLDSGSKRLVKRRLQIMSEEKKRHPTISKYILSIYGHLDLFVSQNSS
ncbi:hypothetical protein CEXT_596811 [Caerostris extrusa]|uniref:Uncharacterized protein n=1 Tax=Caerostris extrusa TaxID=172846 RepID=A0AAV4UV15_CAEEX|nr:hypothetical protein CEXT_596811 [Caerostris extrusa]